MGIFDDIQNAISFGEQLGKYILAGIIIVLVVIFVIWALSQTIPMIYDQREAIVENVQKLCNYEDLVKKELTQAIANSLESNTTKWQALKLLQGGELSDCEWQEFLTHLNNVEKKKLKINDLVCDAVNCIP